MVCIKKSDGTHVDHVIPPRLLFKTVSVKNCPKFMSVDFVRKKTITGLDRPLEFQEVEASRFQDNRHIKMVRLSALRTGHFYPPRNIPGTYFR